MAGCATPASSAGHPNRSVTTDHALTLTSDHLVGAGHGGDAMAHPREAGRLPDVQMNQLIRALTLITSERLPRLESR